MTRTEDEIWRGRCFEWRNHCQLWVIWERQRWEKPWTEMRVLSDRTLFRMNQMRALFFSGEYSVWKNKTELRVSYKDLARIPSFFVFFFSSFFTSDSLSLSLSLSLSSTSPFPTSSLFQGVFSFHSSFTVQTQYSEWSHFIYRNPHEQRV